VGELLLLSNSTAPGRGFLEHATEAIRAVLGDRGSLLLGPFASSDLREGAWLQVSGPRAHLSGRNTGRLFRRHTEPIDVPVGADLSDLLNTCPRFDIGATT